jgi:hypothetical protein
MYKPSCRCTSISNCSFLSQLSLVVQESEEKLRRMQPEPDYHPKGKETAKAKEHKHEQAQVQQDNQEQEQP